MTNRPPLQDQVDKLERKLALMEEVVTELLNAQLPAMQAIDAIQQAGLRLQALRDAEQD